MKLGNIINALPALQKLAGESLTVRTLYRVNKLMRRLDKEIDFFNAERNKAIEELCEKDEGNKFIIPEANRDALNKRLQELSDIDTEPDIEPLKLFTDENIRLSYNDLKALEGIVELVEADEE